MKKVILSAVAVLFVATTIVFANSGTKKSTTCVKTKEGKCCPITPECQPGDPNCVCPFECKK